jgi:hypothetical protein
LKPDPHLQGLISPEGVGTGAGHQGEVGARGADRTGDGASARVAQDHGAFDSLPQGDLAKIQAPLVELGDGRFGAAVAAATRQKGHRKENAGQQGEGGGKGAEDGFHDASHIRRDIGSGHRAKEAHPSPYRRPDVAT